MEETTIKVEQLEKLKTVFAKFYKLDNMELDSKQIFNLRRKIKHEKKEGYDNKLRAITLYSHTKDEQLKIYINKLYIEYFQK